MRANLIATVTATLLATSTYADVLLVKPYEDKVLRVDDVTYEVKGEIPASVPYSVAVSETLGKMYSFTHYSVDVIDLATGEILTQIPAIETRYGIFDKEHTTLYVTDYEASAVLVIDTATDTLVTQIPVNHPMKLCFCDDGYRLFVTTWDGVAVIDTATYQVVNTIYCEQAYDLKAKAGKLFILNNLGYTTPGYVEVYDLATMTYLGTVPTGRHPLDLEVTDDAMVGYVTNGMDNNVSVIDLSGMANMGALPAVKLPASAKWHKKKLFVVNFSAEVTDVYNEFNYKEADVTVGTKVNDVVAAEVVPSVVELPADDANDDAGDTEVTEDRDDKPFKVWCHRHHRWHPKCHDKDCDEDHETLTKEEWKKLKKEERHKEHKKEERHKEHKKCKK